MIAQLSTGVTINLPLTAHEIQWEAHCDFKNDEEVYFNLLEKEDVKSVFLKMDNKETLSTEECGLVAALNMAIAEALKHVYGDWVFDLKPSLEDEKSDDLFYNHYTVSLGDDLSIMRLYAHHTTIINTFKPDTLTMKVFKIMVDGEEYQLDQMKAAKFLTMDACSTGETIEVLEFRRISEKNIEKKAFGLGNMDFTLGLREIAILMRKKGEPLPWKRNELDNFLDSRMQLFKGVTAAEVLTLRFFLINSYLIWLQNQTTNFSGTAHPIKVQELSRKKPGIVKRRRGKRLS